LIYIGRVYCSILCLDKQPYIRSIYFQFSWASYWKDFSLCIGLQSWVLCFVRTSKIIIHYKKFNFIERSLVKYITHFISPLESTCKYLNWIFINPLQTADTSCWGSSAQRVSDSWYLESGRVSLSNTII